MSPPEKEFFSLDEIVARWRHTGCDRTTLLDYARRDLLVFSVYLRDLGSHKTVRETGESRITTTTTVAFSFVAPGYKQSSIRYLKSDDARRVLECREGQSAAVFVLYSSPLRDKASGTGYMHAHHLTAADLVVSKGERDRFEREHRIDLAKGRLARLWARLADPENHRALTLIGGAIVASAVAGWTVFAWLAPRIGLP